MQWLLKKIAAGPHWIGLLWSLSMGEDVFLYWKLYFLMLKLSPFQICSDTGLTRFFSIVPTRFLCISPLLAGPLAWFLLTSSVILAVNNIIIKDFKFGVRCCCEFLKMDRNVRAELEMDIPSSICRRALPLRLYQKPSGYFDTHGG